MPKTILKFLILTIILTAALGVNYLFAAWVGPTQAPPDGNTSTPVHIGTTNQVKDGGLSLDSLAVFGGGYFQGDVDVDGGIKVGNTVTETAGTIRWTGTDLEVYTGTEWKSLIGELCPVGEEIVTFASGDLCLNEGDIVSVSCVASRNQYGDVQVFADGWSRYSGGNIQTRVRMRTDWGCGMGTACDTGWVNGTYATCTGTNCGVSGNKGEATSDINGVKVVSSVRRNCTAQSAPWN